MATMPRPLPNSYWVLPGSLLAGEYPLSDTRADNELRLQRLLSAGIDTFLDLTDVGELPEYRSLLPREVRYARSAIPDTQVPADPAQMRAIQAHLHDQLAAGRRLYVHCRAGIGRTGIVVGCYLAEQGLEGAAALKRLNRLWRQSERSKSWPKVPQTREQAEFIQKWAPQRKRGFADV
jgi:Protein-tyrosine phosphatase